MKTAQLCYVDHKKLMNLDSDALLSRMTQMH